MNMTRKEFLAGMAGGTVVLLIQGCGGGGGGDSGDSTLPPANTCGAAGITANHGHALTIARADLDSATDKVYSIMGSATHDHTITLTPAMLATLKAGTQVVVTSSVAESHNHGVTVSCA